MMLRNDHDALCRQAADNGRLIEAGWLALRYVTPATSPLEIAAMRKAFFMGAQHLFASILSMLESGAEPTAQDVARLSGIADELNTFVDQQRAQRK